MKHIRSLVLMMGIGASIASAVPITYSINFTTTLGTPAGPFQTPAGGFTYDAATTTFSSFLVTWSGIVFDLTGSAAAPSATLTCGPASAAATFAFLTNPGCGGATTVREFSVSVQGTAAQFRFREVGSTGQLQISTSGVVPVSRTPAGSSGTFSASEVPEPTSSILVMAGGALLTLLGIRRGRQRRCEAR